MNRQSVISMCFAIGVAPLTAARSAHAEGEPAVSMQSPSAPVVDRGSASEKPAFSIGAKPVWYFMGGVTTGGTVAASDRGGLIGGELSVVRLARGGRFFGLYGDSYYAFGIDRTYATGGVELGYKFIGIDGGIATRLGPERAEVGGTARLFFTVGLVSIYGRYALFPDPILRGNENVLQVGALVKVPLAIWGLK